MFNLKILAFLCQLFLQKSSIIQGPICEEMKSVKKRNGGGGEAKGRREVEDTWRF